MKSAIISALAFAVTAIAAPAVTCGPGDTDSFAISDFVFHGDATYSTPAHLAVSQANVTFQLKLPSKPKLLSCSATTEGTYPNYFNGQTSYDCVSGKTTSASFKYNSNSQRLEIHGSWSCPAQGSRFDASGHGKVLKKADCETETVRSSTPGIYQDIITTCSADESAIKISEISGVA